MQPKRKKACRISPAGFNLTLLKTCCKIFLVISRWQQFAGQEFLSSGKDKLYFWTREAKSSSTEVDFILSKKNTIIPIEIKGGAAGKLRSMHLLLEKYPHIERAYVLSTSPYGELPEQRLVFLSLYYPDQFNKDIAFIPNA